MTSERFPSKWWTSKTKEETMKAADTLSTIRAEPRGEMSRQNKAQYSWRVQVLFHFISCLCLRIWSELRGAHTGRMDTHTTTATSFHFVPAKSFMSLFGGEEKSAALGLLSMWCPSKKLPILDSLYHKIGTCTASLLQPNFLCAVKKTSQNRNIILQSYNISYSIF